MEVMKIEQELLGHYVLEPLQLGLSHFPVSYLYI